MAGEDTSSFSAHVTERARQLRRELYQQRAQRKSQVAFRVENAFDEIYPALRGFRAASYDDGSGSFLSMLQGSPRTFHVSYRYSF